MRAGHGGCRCPPGRPPASPGVSSVVISPTQPLRLTAWGPRRVGTLQEDRKERTRAPSATQAPAGSGPGPAGRAAPVFSELGPQGHRWPPLQWDRERVTEQRRPVQRDQASGGAGRGACFRQGLRMRGSVRLRLSRAAVRRGHARRRDQLVRRPSGVAGQWAGAAAPPPPGAGERGGPAQVSGFPLLDLVPQTTGPSWC